jgi:hypothetical protein
MNDVQRSAGAVSNAVTSCCRIGPRRNPASTFGQNALPNAPPHLLELLEHPFPSQPRETIDPENTVDLIDFVLQAHGQEAVCLFRLFNAAEISTSDVHAGRVLDCLGDAGHGNASLCMAGAFVQSADDAGIDINPYPVARQLEQHHSFEDADVRPGNPDVGCGAHGIEEIISYGPQLFIEDLNFQGGRAQMWVEEY